MHDIFPVSTRKSKLSVRVIPAASGLCLGSTYRSQRCLRIEKKVEYGYVIDDGCAEWETFQLP